MDKPKIKLYIEHIGDKLDIDNTSFRDVLAFYYKFLNSDIFKKKIISTLFQDQILFFQDELSFVEKNVHGILSELEKKEKKTFLWGIHDNSSGLFRGLVRLLITGFCSENSMLNYSNYEEYIVEDFLELAVSCVFDMKGDFPELLINFVDTYQKET